MTPVANHFAGLLFGLCTLIQVAPSSTDRSDGSRGRKFPFVEIQAENQRERHICLGLAATVSSLEEGIEFYGEMAVADLADEIWKKLHDPKYDLRYPRVTVLGDRTRVMTCSTAAIQVLAFLIQTRFTQMANRLWQGEVKPDPNTNDGKALLRTRRKYLACYEERIIGLQELKSLIKNDSDGLVAIVGRGVRQFQDFPEHKKAKDNNESENPRAKSFYTSESNHAFLITFDTDDEAFYVFDSDDPDRKWLAYVHNDGENFMLTWSIADHMGNGPSTQTYFQFRPLPDYLMYMQRIKETRNDPH